MFYLLLRLFRCRAYSVVVSCVYTEKGQGEQSTKRHTAQFGYLSVSSFFAMYFFPTEWRTLDPQVASTICASPTKTTSKPAFTTIQFVARIGCLFYIPFSMHRRYPSRLASTTAVVEAYFRAIGMCPPLDAATCWPERRQPQQIENNTFSQLGCSTRRLPQKSGCGVKCITVSRCLCVGVSW